MASRQANPCAYQLCTCMHSQTHRSTQTENTQHSHGHRQHQQPYPIPSLTDQDESSLVENIYTMYTILIPPSSGLRHLACPVAASGSECAHLHAPGHTRPQVPSPKLPFTHQQISTGTHTHSLTLQISLVTSLRHSAYPAVGPWTPISLNCLMHRHTHTCKWVSLDSSSRLMN